MARRPNFSQAYVCKQPHVFTTDNHLEAEHKLFNASSK